MRAMRPISSVRAVGSIGTGTSSLRITRSGNRSCSTMTSFASVNNRLQKIIVNLALNVQQ
jgi:hypothetical protein